MHFAHKACIFRAKMIRCTNPPLTKYTSSAAHAAYYSAGMLAPPHLKVYRKKAGRNKGGGGITAEVQKCNNRSSTCEAKKPYLTKQNCLAKFSKMFPLNTFREFQMSSQIPNGWCVGAKTHSHGSHGIPGSSSCGLCVCVYTHSTKLTTIVHS